MTSRIVRALLLVAVLGFAALASAQVASSSLSFNFIPFDYPGADSTQPIGINNADIIVGYFNAAGETHGFARLPNGTFIQVDYPGSSGRTILAGLNDANLAVGLYTDSNSLFQGFDFRYPNRFTSINYPGAAETTPYGINNSGQIVGAWDNGQLQGGFLLTNGSYTDLLYPGAALTYPVAINSAGIIAGSWASTCNPQCQEQGFLLSGVGGTYLDVAYPGSTVTDVSGLNDLNHVVGTYIDAFGVFHCWAGVPAKNRYITIDYPGAASCLGSGITNKGHITGSYSDSNNVAHGFLAVPK